MRMVLLGEVAISSQTAVKRSFFVLAELGRNGLSCSREGHSGLLSHSYTLSDVVCPLLPYLRNAKVGVIKSTHCEKPDGF